MLKRPLFPRRKGAIFSGINESIQERNAMPYHVLLVDDDRHFRDQFCEFVEDFDVIEAQNGQEALEILSRPHNIDLIVLDERLPQARGTDLLEKISDCAPQVKTVILTGFSSKEVAIDAVKGHAADYIEKPLTHAKIERIKDLVLSTLHGERNKPDSGVKGKIEQAQYFAQRNYDKKLTLQDVAQEVCLSPKYLSRVFKQKTGKSFLEYKLELRMNKAKELLRESGDNVEEISCKLGYQNPESFGKIFRQLIGLTPREYRDRENQKKETNRVRQEHQRKKEYKDLVTANRMLSDSRGVILEYDLDGRILSWPKSAEAAYGWKEKEMLGRDCVVGPLRKTFRSLMEQSVSPEKDQRECHIIRRTRLGKKLDVWCKIFPVRNTQGAVVYFLVFERNITSRKKREMKLMTRELVQARKKTQLAEEALEKSGSVLARARQELEKEKYFGGLGRMASIVAHEMRRPINSIRMASWNIAKKNENPDLERNISCIEEMVEESEQIISNLLNYARIKLPSYQQVVMSTLISRCVESARKRFASKRVTVRMNLQALGRKRIETDPLQFKQILSNIIMNAFESIPKTKKGRIVVTASTRAEELVLTVKDNGCGISAEDLPLVQDPFFSNKQKGTGLGLSICQELTALHNGRLSISSNAGKGTTVTVTLPLRARR